ncbi:hypothetical protein GCM10011332_32340 [Terasakiella brassicae]|uniref:DUF4230 domain-containing protein n=1 Tax=Terasakiella brassicae TaxID=1634917 RepID=A0A917CA01_9PROT|nr:DUF4230 domain-containing protein [Terasakiella brassicae]GGF75881.1 hypothetical protein GCM10011332_32340 [Terasakiella brassicae]
MNKLLMTASAGIIAMHVNVAYAQQQSSWWEDIKTELCFFCTNVSKVRNQSLTALAEHASQDKQLVTLVVEQTRKMIVKNEDTSLDGSLAAQVKTAVSNRLFANSVEAVIPARISLGIDLAAIQPQHVTVNNGKLVIKLPDVIIVAIEADLSNSKLISDSGFLVPKQQETDMLVGTIASYKKALGGEILQDAKHVKHAKEGAEKAIRDILEPLLTGGVQIQFIS